MGTKMSSVVNRNGDGRCYMITRIINLQYIPADRWCIRVIVVIVNIGLSVYWSIQCLFNYLL